jgi:serine phosphatase RsbU (regulator of sigma subunit)
VPASGTLIGVVPQITVRSATVELAPGELCLLYSDGLTEARGGPSGHEHYGEHRLRDALSSCKCMPGVAAVERGSPTGCTAAPATTSPCWPSGPRPGPH